MSESSADEARTWVAAAAGDSASFGELFDRHRDRVFRHAFRLLRSVADADDASATAFLELWRRRRHVRLVDGSILPWLLVTTTYVARNLQRSASRYRQVIDSLPRGSEGADAASAYLDQHPLEAVDPRLAGALRRLPVADMQLFALVAFEDFPVAAAAAAIGISEAAAKTRLHRVRKRLKAELADVGYRTPAPSVSLEATGLEGTGR